MPGGEGGGGPGLRAACQGQVQPHFSRVPCTVAFLLSTAPHSSPCKVLLCLRPYLRTASPLLCCTLPLRMSAQGKRFALPLAVPWHSSRHWHHPWNGRPWHSRIHPPGAGGWRCPRVGRTLAMTCWRWPRGSQHDVGCLQRLSPREAEWERKKREMLRVDITISSLGGLERGWRLRLPPHIPRYCTSGSTKRTCHYQFVSSFFPFVSVSASSMFPSQVCARISRGAYRGLGRSLGAWFQLRRPNQQCGAAGGYRETLSLPRTTELCLCIPRPVLICPPSLLARPLRSTRPDGVSPEWRALLDRRYWTVRWKSTGSSAVSTAGPAPVPPSTSLTATALGGGAASPTTPGGPEPVQLP